jgi:hypothetical protein
MPCCDFSALESLDEFRSIVDDVDVILAVNTSPHRGFACVYGGDLLRLHAGGGLRGRLLKTIAFAVNFGGHELEMFLAAVFETRGSYEWNGEVVTNLDTDGVTAFVLGGWGCGKRGRG